MNDGTRYYPTTDYRLPLTLAERRLVDAACARLEAFKAKQAAARAKARAGRFPVALTRRERPRAA